MQPLGRVAQQLTEPVGGGAPLVRRELRMLPANPLPALRTGADLHREPLDQEARLLWQVHRRGDFFTRRAQLAPAICAGLDGDRSHEFLDSSVL